MNYALNITGEKNKKGSLAALRELFLLLGKEKSMLAFALVAMLANAALNLAAPMLIGRAIDTYIVAGQYAGVLRISVILLGMYVGALGASYLQTKLMGTVGQRMLFNLRNSIFTKLGELPISFFNQNKAGDLISRINNDTDKLNQFFSQSLMQFVGSIFIMVGAGIFLLSINIRLGLAALAPAVFIVIFTTLVSPWVKRANARSLASTGGMSAEIAESIEHFKVIIAFNRRDYFRNRFDAVNKDNYRQAVTAGFANNIFTPVYALAANIAQLAVLGYGVSLIARGNFTIGLLVSFFSYATNFYNPLRQLAALWANFQVAMAGWDRISAILALESDLVTLPETEATDAKAAVLEFSHVNFSYPNGKSVLSDTSFRLERGKTYALVGPTGGGKTTTASLIARLYDPTDGAVFLEGKDIRSYSSADRTRKIGFILQEPFLFSGTLRDNIVYGNTRYEKHTSAEVEALLDEAALGHLLSRFENGLDTSISAADTISIGQKQIIAFIRAVLRKPDILILDEATANIDTVTEVLLGEILDKLPPETTRIIIAHRLNTIENADEIFFVNAGSVTRAGSMKNAIEMLSHGKRTS